MNERTAICQLINKDDLRLVFDLSEVVEIEQSEDDRNVCSYSWSTTDEEITDYALKLNFARGGKHSANEIESIWKNQNDQVYERYNLQDVADVGERASWSQLGGGQLRVVVNGFLFYVSLRVTPNEKNSLDTPEMIDKTSVLAKQVIKRMALETIES